ncbi:predicted protein [Naegleria gruberi]|uniref:Predicted protein n=1 Tax=Naegleria gruberi TaxID=5762 RepID=D2VHF5_NAEGR|nr:uncharacterized protein NAEGRDRAFT_68310 [Naegleria gruberi]EFC43671.1 predicted protein [Naegleria gruberi]|eukprot:XP_002676415.1 predicted protein [Naegleria gruberi strain NEG-M]
MKLHSFVFACISSIFIILSLANLLNHPIRLDNCISTSSAFVNGQIYQFSTEFTKNISESVYYSNDDTNYKSSTINASTTISYVSLSYEHGQGTISWKFLFDEHVESLHETNETLSFYYFRIIHNNLLSTKYQNSLFLPSRTSLLQEYPISVIQTKSGMDLTYEKMVFHINGTTSKNAFMNSTKYLDIPELFTNSYAIQWFLVKLDLADIRNKIESGMFSQELVNAFNDLQAQVPSKNLNYNFTTIQQLNQSVSIDTVLTSSSINNICGSTSPVVAFSWNSWKLWFVLCMVILMLVCLVVSLWRPYFIVVMTLVIFNLAGIVSVTDALSGFSNTGTLIVALLFPIVKPLSENTLVLKFARLLFGSPLKFKNSKNKFLNFISLIPPTLRICFVFTIFSAFVSNTPVVATGIPIIMEWARTHKLSHTKFLMSLLFATNGGGLLTYIGTSASIVANGIYTQYGYTPLSFYEFVYVGAILCFITIIYCCTYTLWIVPNEGVTSKFNASKVTFAHKSKKERAREVVREHSETFVTIVKMEYLASQPKYSKGKTLFETLNGKTKVKAMSELGIGNLDLIEILREKKSTNQVELSSVQSSSQPTTSSEPNVISNGESIEIKVEEPKESPEQSTNSSNSSTSSNTIIPATNETVAGLEKISPVPLDLKLESSDILVFQGAPQLILRLHSLVYDGSEIEKSTFESSESVNQKEEPKMATGQSTTSFLSVESPMEEGRISQSSCVASSTSQDHLIDSPTTSPQAENPVTNQLHHNIKKNYGDAALSNEKSKTNQSEIQENEPEFFQVVIGASNPCLGETYLEFERRYQVKVLAIRQVGSSSIDTKETNDKDSHVNCKTVYCGDTILILGKSVFYHNNHDNSKDFYLITRFNEISPDYNQFKQKPFLFRIPFTKIILDLWWWEHWIFPFFLAMIGCAIAGFPMVQCTLVTFCAVVAFGLITPTRAVDCVEWRLVTLVGASFGIAAAITQSGVAEALTEILRLMNMPTLLLPACITLISLVTYQSTSVSVYNL